MKSSSKDFIEKVVESIQNFWLLAVLVRFIPLMLLNPEVLDWIRAFIPYKDLAKILPKFLFDYIDAGANWTVTAIWIIVALALSSYSVHRHNQKRYRETLEELQNKLSVYENHKPNYDIVINEVKTSKDCKCHTHITGSIKITPKNAWEGVLNSKPFIQCEDNLVAEAFFKEDCKLTIFKINFPYVISTDSVTALRFDLKFPLSNEDINKPFLSESVPFRVEVVYTYYASALGHPVEDKQPARFDVDLLNIERY